MLPPHLRRLPCCESRPSLWRPQAEAFTSWRTARKTSKFGIFAPQLESMFELKAEVATITRPDSAEPYDGAIDQFERGMTAKRIDEIFGELRPGLVHLLDTIMVRGPQNEAS